MHVQCAARSHHVPQLASRELGSTWRRPFVPPRSRATFVALAASAAPLARRSRRQVVLPVLSRWLGLEMLSALEPCSSSRMVHCLHCRRLCCAADCAQTCSRSSYFHSEGANYPRFAAARRLAWRWSCPERASHLSYRPVRSSRQAETQVLQPQWCYEAGERIGGSRSSVDPWGDAVSCVAKTAVCSAKSAQADVRAPPWINVLRGVSTTPRKPLSENFA